MLRHYEKRVYYAWLASAQIHTELLIKLLNQFNGPEKFFDFFTHNRKSFENEISVQSLNLLTTNAHPVILDRFQAVMSDNNIHAFSFHDGIYPDLFLHVSPKPAILFYQGNTRCMQNRIVGMIGSRTATYNGQKATKKIASELSRRGISIISGFAAGIDSSAHLGCVEGGSPTIAVMGCGLDIIYPASNRDLRNKILQNNGLLLSEFVPSEKPIGWHFPLRNRIISGLSQALIMMEAKIKSGSMTTVHHALDQGKDVFVYPGDPSSPMCEGNHQLLREGARFFTKAEDILEDLGWLDIPADVRQNSDCSSEADDNDPNAALICKFLQKGALSFEELLKYTSLSSSELMSKLTILQISGIIEALPGKIFQIVR